MSVIKVPFGGKPPLSDIDRYIGYQFKLLRREHRKTRAAVSKALEIDEADIAEYEDGSKRIMPELMALITMHFDVPIKYFFPDFQTDPASEEELTPLFLAPDAQRLLRAFESIKSRKQRAAIVQMVERSSGLPADKYNS